MTKEIKGYSATRRGALGIIGGGMAVLAAPSILRAQSASKIKIGYISPVTGQLSQFGATVG